MRYPKFFSILVSFFFIFSLVPAKSVHAEIGGRIKGRLIGSCGPATIVVSWNPTPSQISVRVFVTDTSGNYDTGCTLPCPYQFTVEATIRSNSDCKVEPPQIVNLTTCCPEGFVEVNFNCDCPEKKGRILGTVYGDCNPAEIVIEQIDPPTHQTWTYTTDLMGNYDTQSYDQCVLPCPGTYTVLARKSSSNCTISAPQTIRLDRCCPADPFRVDFNCSCNGTANGRIFGKINGNCGKVKITVEQSYPNIGTWEFYPDELGNYESSSPDQCFLPCPAIYTVTATVEGSNCKISDPQTISMNNCCGNGASKVDFNCECTKEKGKIVGKVTGNCGIMSITIDELYPEEKSWTISTDSSGYYDSSVFGNCVLDCPGYYKVTAKKYGTTCVISQPQTVTLTNCCPTGYQRVDFSCECKESKGRIFGTVTSEVCLPAKITIARNYPGTGTWTFTTDANGYYESSTINNCILPVPGTYTVGASVPGSNCSFGPAQIVKLEKACPEESYRIDFTSQASTAKGIILGAVYGECKAGVKITITGLGSTVGTWTATSDVYGNFQSSSTANCILPCPGKYLVSASLEGSACTFSSPQTINLTSCCGRGYSRVNFTSTSNKPKGRIMGTVEGSTNPVKITITGISPTSGVWTFTTDENGQYDTNLDGSCNLPCPGTYRVVASKSGSSCTFSDPKTIVLTKCCPDGYEIANFTSDCSNVPKGRIKGTVSGTCGPVDVTITGVPLSLGTWTFRTNDQGIYDSSPDGNCVLPCPGKYVVSITKPNTNCTVSGPQTVSLTNCCPSGSLVVNFTCNCPPEPKAKIIGFVSGYANPVTITITQADPPKTWVVKTGPDGYYDTGCVLVCPGKFTVTPSKPDSQIIFSPSYKTVSISNCCPNGYVRVDFDRISLNKISHYPKSSYISEFLPILFYLTNDPNPFQIYSI